MPKLTATDGLAAAETVKRVDVTREDIRNMSDEALTEFFANLRKMRETGPTRPRKAAVAQTNAGDAVIDDIDGEF